MEKKISKKSSIRLLQLCRDLNKASKIMNTLLSIKKFSRVVIKNRK